MLSRRFIQPGERVANTLAESFAKCDARPSRFADLIAHRRYAYGKAAVEDSDWAVAADMFEPTARAGAGLGAGVVCAR